MLRSFNKKHNISNKHYPSYTEIQKAKADCYPYNINVKDDSASVSLQSIIDHTIYRLISSFTSEQLNNINNNEITLLSKWRMDGASGQQNIKQNFQNSNTTDSSVFAVMFVPLQITASSNTVWSNNRPNSTRLCRPISFKFIKENSEHTVETFNFYQREIEHLQPTTFENIFGISCTVKYNFQCTMVDGKTVNTLTDQKSSSSCNVCRAKPKQMNDLPYVMSFPCNEYAFEFGLSPLHCRIRLMECILHISYNRDFKQGSARGPNKTLKSERKLLILKQFKENLGLQIDIVKQGILIVF